MDKVYHIPEEAVANIRDGSMIAIGGFFATGVPRALLRAIIAKNVRDLTLACGSGPLMGAADEAKRLVENGQIRKVIDSYCLPRSASKGRDNPLEKKIRQGLIELEVYPMGTLAEKYRAAGAGIPAFYVETGAGSLVQESVLTNIEKNRQPKEIRRINGRDYVLEYAVKPDVALVHAYKGDWEGNLQFRKTARNFNHIMAMAGQVTIAEVENLVEPGEIEPDKIHTPGIFVQRIVQASSETYAVSID